MINIINNPHLPNFELHTVLHGEEKLHMIHKRLENGATYNVRSELIDIIDKGDKKGAVLIDRITGYLVNEKGEESPAYYVDRSVFARTLGGSGFKGTGKSANLPSTPKRKPDVVLKDKTFINQALLYRLNSDPNPLHVDPNIAALARYERPIIHGKWLLIQDWPHMEQLLVQLFRTYWAMMLKKYNQLRLDLLGTYSLEKAWKLMFGRSRTSCFSKLRWWSARPRPSWVSSLPERQPNCDLIAINAPILKDSLLASAGCCSINTI